MNTRRTLAAVALLGAVALTAAACGDSDDSESGDAASVPDGPDIVIGAQDFGESAILAQVYGQSLASLGYPISYQSLGGFRDIVFTSFDSGDINFTAEYAASALEFLNGEATEATPDITETMNALEGWLADLGLQTTEPSPAVDSNSFVVTQETADELGLSAVSDLTEDLRLGGPPDCEENASCIPGLQRVYDLDLSANFVPLDGGGPLTKEALGGGEIDVAIIFSTDGSIAENGWVVLEDDKGLINADNIVPVMTDEVAEAYGDELIQAVDDVSLALSTEALTEMNKRFDIDKEDAEVIATEWLESEGLLAE